MMPKASEAQNTTNHNKTNANSNLEAENRIRSTPPPLEAQTDDELDKILDKYIDARVLFPERIKADRSKAKQAVKAWSDRRVEVAVKEALREELIGVQRELGKNNIAGQVKWYVEDRLAELKQGGTVK